MTNKQQAIEAITKTIDYQFGGLKEYLYPKGYENSLKTASEQILSLPAVADYFKEVKK